MKNKNSNSLMLITGVIAGAASVYFLKSEKGQQMVDLLLTKGEELKTNISEKASTALEEGHKIKNNLIEGANEKVSNTKDMITGVADNTKTKINSKISNFQDGIDKAKKELNKA